MPTSVQFRKARRQQCKAAIMIEGLSGKGKSGLAIAIAMALANKDASKIYIIDTENRSIDLYVGLTLHTGDKILDDSLNTANLTVEDGFNPRSYAALRDAAIAQGGTVVIMDSISHAWQYKGGILDMVSTINNKGYQNKYAAWGDKEVAAEKACLMDLIRNDKVHIITTVRVKEKMEIVPDENGKNTIKSLGEQQIQMPDLKYEPDLVLSMVAPGNDDPPRPPKVKVVKSRYAILKPDEEYAMTSEMLEQLRAYLAEGADPAELLEKQRQDIIAAIKEFINEDKDRRAPMWEAIKENAGHKGTKLNDLSLKELKPMFGMLVS